MHKFNFRITLVFMLVLYDYPNADPYQKYVNADCVLVSKPEII